MIYLHFKFIQSAFKYTQVFNSHYLQNSTKLMKIWKSFGLEACKPWIGSDDASSNEPELTITWKSFDLIDHSNTNYMYQYNIICNIQLMSMTVHYNIMNTYCTNNW